MPKSTPNMPGSARQCRHEVLQVDISRYAKEAGCSPPSDEQRQAATTTKRSGRPYMYKQPGGKDASTVSLYTFPAPLTLPDDLLALGDDEPPQSMLSWIRVRTPVTQARKTIYVVRTPSVDERVSFMQAWTVPTTAASTKLKMLEPPRLADVSAYLEAFYYPLPVKTLPQEVSFVPWETAEQAKPLKGRKKKAPMPAYVGLKIGDGITRIRSRPCPDAVFGGQLNLNDLLDGALHVLPADAYAILLLVDHDLYEDDEDYFCCGRAYGGSRVCIVSSSRYHPALDTLDYYIAGGIDLAHMWPASHCQAFVEGVWSLHDPRPPAKKRKRTQKKKRRQKPKVPADDVPAGLDVSSTPMGAALRAVRPLSDLAKELQGLWFSRVARTVSHELGHCFRLGHCSYYACVMQGTASVAEDLRQPPYLCPVCLAKVTHALMGVSPGTGDTEQAYAVQRYQALMEFCQGWLHVGMFAGFHAWLEKRVQVLSAGNSASSPFCLD